MSKRYMGLITALIIACGCASSGPKQKTGAVYGGLLGAAAGGIIGHQSGRGLEGAAIGGALGAVGGAMVGSDMDNQAAAVNPEHISVIQIADMAGRGIPDEVIISEIKRTGSVYQLSSEVITYLKQHQVSDAVINYMMSSGR